MEKDIIKTRNNTDKLLEDLKELKYDLIILEIKEDLFSVLSAASYKNVIGRSKTEVRLVMLYQGKITKEVEEIKECFFDEVISDEPEGGKQKSLLVKHGNGLIGSLSEENINSLGISMAKEYTRIGLNLIFKTSGSSREIQKRGLRIFFEYNRISELITKYLS
jgi:hypothetical protein